MKDSFMQFQVPQFLDVEDKIIGPFTIKQFLYLTGGVGLGYLCVRFIPYLGWFLGIGSVALGAALGFYKFNSKPFVFVVESAFHYLRSDHLYVWRRREKVADAPLDLSNFKPVKHSSSILANKSGSKLSDLTWSIDVKQDNEVEAQKVHTESAV